MQRRLLLVGAIAAGVLAVVATAGATTTSSSAASLTAAPFAQSWANVPRTPAARRAKSVLVFGMEQDVSGFNVGE
jgi:hypothetical protein